jgi:protein O-GlcNAc transferase
MKVFSFSIYGDNPIYTIGGVKNAKLVKELFPEWKSIFYIADNVNPDIIKQIESYDGIVELKPANESFTGMFWRFMAISRNDVDVMIVRDCDSRISERDVISINEFIGSNNLYHIVRDHPIGHHYPMNGGMWGCKQNPFINRINHYIKDFLNSNYKHIFNTDNAKQDSIRNADQMFLMQRIYPIVINNCIVHDEYFRYEPFSKPINHDRKSNDFAFIGESIDENDNPRGDQRTPIKKIYDDNKLIYTNNT